MPDRSAPDWMRPGTSLPERVSRLETEVARLKDDLRSFADNLRKDTTAGSERQHALHRHAETLRTLAEEVADARRRLAVMEDGAEARTRQETANKEARDRLMVWVRYGLGVALAALAALGGKPIEGLERIIGLLPGGG